MQKNAFYSLPTVDSLEIRKNKLNSIQDLKTINNQEAIEKVMHFFKEKKYSRKTRGTLEGDIILEFYKNEIHIFTINIDVEVGINNSLSYRTQVLNENINIQTYLSESDFLTLLSMLSIFKNEIL